MSGRLQIAIHYRGLLYPARRKAQIHGHVLPIKINYVWPEYIGTYCQNSYGQGPRIPGPKTPDGTNSAKRPRWSIALAINHSHTTYIVPLFAGP